MRFSFAQQQAIDIRDKNVLVLPVPEVARPVFLSKGFASLCYRIKFPLIRFWP